MLGKKYYVYAHVNPMTGKYFYIGKGTGDRINNTHGRTSIWKEYVAQLYAKGLAYETKILHVCDTEPDALKKEDEEIKQILGNGDLLLNQMCRVRVQKEVLFNVLQTDDLPDSANVIADFVRSRRKQARLTQSEFAQRGGVGLRFVRELEAGKKSLRIDKVNQVLWLLGSCLVPYSKK